MSVLAALPILIHYLIRRPALTPETKLRLALGLGLLPLFAAGSSTQAGLAGTTERKFCGSCHVMDMHVADADNLASDSLAARHSRNPFFGDRNCYVCHADYGMLGYPVTKINGMKHVYSYYLGGFHSLTMEEALPRLELFKPYENLNCMQCHSGAGKLWSDVPEHQALRPELEQNLVSCASVGCHGYAHPFSKSEKAAGLQRLMDEPLRLASEQEDRASLE